MNNKKPKNPVCAIWWYDAAYVFQEKLPEETPQPILTIGFVIESNNDFTHIATEVGYDEDTGKIVLKRGVFIPDGAIMRFKKIGFLHEQE